MTSHERVLILSWEYPPLIEGGLARHVRKLSEALVERDTEVHVLTRGGEESPAEELMAGVHVHRVMEPTRPAELNEFVAWVERMNSDMLAAGVELGDRSTSTSSTATTGSSPTPATTWRAVSTPPRHHDPRHRARSPPGLGRQAPAVLHPRGRALDHQPLRPGDRLLHLHARADRRRLRRRRVPGRGDPNGIDPRLQPHDDDELGAARPSSPSRTSRWSCSSGGCLREGLPVCARGAAARSSSGSPRPASSSRAPVPLRRSFGARRRSSA